MLDKPICQILSLSLIHTRTHPHTPQHTRTHTHHTPQHTHTHTHTPQHTTRTPLRHLSISPPDPHGVHPPGQWMLNNPTNYSTVYLVQMSSLQRNRQTSRMTVGPGSLIDLVKECKAVYTHTTPTRMHTKSKIFSYCIHNHAYLVNQHWDICALLRC